MMNQYMMVKGYMEIGNLEDALLEIEKDTKDRIGDYIDEMRDYELFEMIRDNFDEDIHPMDELDDVYSDWSVTDILERLTDIDTGDDYFTEDGDRSSCDIWDLLSCTRDYIVKSIYNRETDICDRYIDEILEDEEWLKRTVTDKYKFYERAEELFKKAMASDPKAVVSVLWNMMGEE